MLTGRPSLRRFRGNLTASYSISHTRRGKIEFLCLMGSVHSCLTGIVDHTLALWDSFILRVPKGFGKFYPKNGTGGGAKFGSGGAEQAAKESAKAKGGGGGGGSGGSGGSNEQLLAVLLGGGLLAFLTSGAAQSSGKEISWQEFTTTLLGEF